MGGREWPDIFGCGCVGVEGVSGWTPWRPPEHCVALRVPAHAPWLARRSMARRATRMTRHAPVRTGGAVGAGWDLD